MKKQKGKIKLGIIAVVAGVLGIVAAMAMEIRPFKQKSNFSTPLVQEKITGLIPGTLKRPVNILILGIDNSGHGPLDSFNADYSFVGNSDTMLLVRISEVGVKILSIPRDTRVRLPGVGIAKINAANIRGGVPLAVKTVTKLLDAVQIDRYVRVNSQGLIHLVDAIGGVEIDVAKAMKYTDQTQHLYINFVPGKQVLNGQKLQEYVRFRDKVGDIGRVGRQQQVLQALTKSLAHPLTIIKMPEIYLVVQKYLDTDLAIGEILALANLTAKNKENLQTIVLPGRPSGSQYRLSYWLVDREKISQILKDFK